MHCSSMQGHSFSDLVIMLTFLMQTNGETQSKFLVVYMDTKVKGTFRGLNIVSDFAGIGRFVTGYRA